MVTHGGVYTILDILHILRYGVQSINDVLDIDELC